MVSGKLLILGHTSLSLLVIALTIRIQGVSHFLTALPPFSLQLCVLVVDGRLSGCWAGETDSAQRVMKMQSAGLIESGAVMFHTDIRV